MLQLLPSTHSPQINSPSFNSSSIPLAKPSSQPDRFLRSPQFGSDEPEPGLRSIEERLLGRVVGWVQQASNGNPPENQRIVGLGRRFSLPATDGEITLIGRGSGNNIVSRIPGVSRAHAGVVRDQGQLYVMDFGTTNGTTVNDLPVQGFTPLQANQEVTLGTAVRFLVSPDGRELVTTQAMPLVESLYRVINSTETRESDLHSPQYLAVYRTSLLSPGRVERAEPLPTEPGRSLTVGRGLTADFQVGGVESLSREQFTLTRLANGNLRLQNNSDKTAITLETGEELGIRGTAELYPGDQFTAAGLIFQFPQTPEGSSPGPSMGHGQTEYLTNG